jgi:hypothetical protein
MLKTAIPVLASLNEEETVKFYTEKLLRIRAATFL